MTDDDFVSAFLHGSLPPQQFHHRDHLRLTWCLVRRDGEEAATGEITTGIRKFAARHGQASKYHETLTRFWIRVVGHMVAARPEIADFETFLAAFPQLLDKDLPYRHWRRETMWAEAAREAWVSPDLLALPA